jgi:hypothetical protein
VNPVNRISPVTDAEAARLARPDTVADLAAQITATPGAVASRRRAPRLLAPRRWLIGAPVAAGLAVAALILTSAGHPGQRLGPVPVGPPAAQALSFTTRNGYITVIVRNPEADPARYNAEFAAHHLNITLSLVPASPSIVGTLVEFDEPAGGPRLIPIIARGRCHTGGGGSACPVGVRVPLGFRGQGHLTFGRAARPGEQYESTAAATAPGEIMHGMSFQGQTVARVLAQLAARQATVPVFNAAGRLLHHVPGGWFVYDASPWAPQQVMLSVGPTPQQPPASPPASGSGPVPSPSPTAPAPRTR